MRRRKSTTGKARRVVGSEEGGRLEHWMGGSRRQRGEEGWMGGAWNEGGFRRDGWAERLSEGGRKDEGWNEEEAERGHGKDEWMGEGIRDEGRG